MMGTLVAKGLSQNESSYSEIIIFALTHVLLNKPLDPGRKLNVHRTFKRRSGCLLNVLCTFNLRHVFMGETVSSSKHGSSPKQDKYFENTTLFKLTFRSTNSGDHVLE